MAFNLGASHRITYLIFVVVTRENQEAALMDPFLALRCLAQERKNFSSYAKQEGKRPQKQFRISLITAGVKRNLGVQYYYMGIHTL